MRSIEGGDIAVRRLRGRWNGHRVAALAGAAALLVVGLLLLTSAPRAAAAYDMCTDSFNCLRLDVGNNNSQPFTKSKTFDATTDISSFTLQSGERANCELANGGLTWGNNSAWYRFDAGVEGTLTVSATTVTGGSSGFPLLMVQYEASHEDPINYQSNADLPSNQCSAHGNSISFGQPLSVHTNGPTFIQLLAYCGDTAPGDTTSPCPNPVSAGPVNLHFAFTATDTDGDGVPDTLDQCPTIYGATASGCPAVPPADSDGDGVPDKFDHCPTIKGPAKYDGCPDNDGDGIPDNLDACPTAKGPPDTNGCPDADGDGIPDSKDKCPHQFAVVGFSTIGNGRLGCPEPLFAFINVSYRAPQARFVDLTSLNAASTPPGARVTVTCSGHRCPKRRLTTQLAKRKNVNLMPALLRTRLRHGKDIRLPTGARLTTIITFKGTLGKSRTIAATGKKGPSFTESCISGTRRIRCPT